MAPLESDVSSAGPLPAWAEPAAAATTPSPLVRDAPSSAPALDTAAISTGGDADQLGQTAPDRAAAPGDIDPPLTASMPVVPAETVRSPTLDWGQIATPPVTRPPTQPQPSPTPTGRYTLPTGHTVGPVGIAVAVGIGLCLIITTLGALPSSAWNFIFALFIVLAVAGFFKKKR
jgi:hypothetical protein